MEKFLNLVRSNNMVQAVLCIAFGLFLMIYPSITVQGVILLFGVALAVMGAAGLVSYFRQRSVRYRDSGTLMSAVFYVIIALIAFIFPKVIAGFFSVVLGVVLILLAIVNVVRAFGLRAFGSGIWIAVLATAVLVGIGGVLIVVNPWGASMTFVLVLGATFIVNGAVDLFIEPAGFRAGRRLCCGASTSRDSAPLGRPGAVRRGKSRRSGSSTPSAPTRWTRPSFLPMPAH